MTDLSKIVLASVALTLMASCTPNPRIESDYTDDRIFGGYKTFNLADTTEVKDPDVAGELELYFGASIMKELQARGLTRSDDPELLISISVALKNVSRPSTKQNRHCPRYEDYYSRKIPQNVSGVPGGGRRPMCIYAEGEINIEIAPAEQDRPVMTGVSKVRLDEFDRGPRLQMAVARDVATMFGDSLVRIDY